MRPMFRTMKRTKSSEKKMKFGEKKTSEEKLGLELEGRIGKLTPTGKRKAAGGRLWNLALTVLSQACIIILIFELVFI